MLNVKLLRALGLIPRQAPRIETDVEDKIRKVFPAMEKGVETILVADDEISIRKLIRDTLEPLGYKIIEAADGEEALELFR